MITFPKRTVLGALTAVAFLGPVAPPAHAYPYQQYYMCYGYCPNGNQHHYMCYGYCPYNPYPYYSCQGYCPYNYPYYNPYVPYSDPYSGYLSGTADVINAQGQYKVSSQQADLVKQQVQREKTENRRHTFNEWLYERQQTPTREDFREQSQAEELRRMQHDPPATEVCSGQALNVLLADSQRLRDLNVPGPVVPLNPQTLRQINVTSGTGNAGVIKNGGRLNWPLALAGTAYEKERDRIDALTRELVKQAAAGPVDVGTFSALRDALEKVRLQLADQIIELPPMEYIHARAFLDDFGSALKVLDQPDAANYFNGKYAAKGATVADLVKYLSDQGLRFAPAVAGEEAAYLAVYQAMAHYDIAANFLTAKR